jgi:hypothetical protein
MSELEDHNPLSMPEHPDFIDDNGNKWWGIGKTAKKGKRAYKCAYVELSDGDKNYVILDKVGVFFETKNLEILLSRFALYREGMLK